MKILVADDSPVLLGAVTKLLEPAGYVVVTAEDGVEAITSFYEEQPDLVLLDVQMPKLTGYVVCRMIKEDPVMSGVPVLILTARDSDEDRYWGAQSGADGYLTKDALGEGLLTAIRSALASRALAELSAGEIAQTPALGEADVLTRVCEMLDRRLFEATVINELTAIGNKAAGLPESIDEVLHGTRRLVRFDVGAVILVDDLKMYVRTAPETSVDDMDALNEFAAKKVASLTSNPNVEAADVRAVHLDTTTELGTENSGGLASFYAAPLRVRGKLVGVLIFGSRKGGVFGEAVFRTLRAIEPAIASVVDSAQRFQQAIADEARSNLAALSGF